MASAGVIGAPEAIDIFFPPIEMTPAAGAVVLFTVDAKFKLAGIVAAADGNCANKTRAHKIDAPIRDMGFMEFFISYHPAEMPKSSAIIAI